MTSVDKMLSVAAAQIGFYAKPGTRTKYGEWYGLPTGQYCAMFLSWCANEAGVTSDMAPKAAYTPTAAQWFKDRNRWTPGTAGIRRGDYVFFNFPDNINRIQHEGIVSQVNGDGSVNTIEGNTSVAGSQSNGGHVARKTRKAYIVGYGRPFYDDAPPVADNRPRNADGSLTIAVDGDRGVGTIGRWQEVMGTYVDGYITRPKSDLIIADQEYLNRVVGPEHQRNLHGRSSLVEDGSEGPKTIVVRQFMLRNFVYLGHQINLIGKPLEFDSINGPLTNKVHQFALNHATSGSREYGRV